MRAIGLAALTVLELPPAEHISVAGQPYQHLVDLPEIEKRLADSGVRVLDVEVFRLAPETRVVDFEPAMAQAARLRASELLVHGADPEEARLVDAFGSFCDLAARYSLAANLEPMPWVEVSTVAKALRILNGAGRSNGALLVDAIHFFRAGDAPISLTNVPASRLRYAQLCDGRPERPADMQEIIRQARADRLFPGEGGLDLPALLKALPPDLPISLEIPHAKPMSALERARRALAAARSLLG